MHDNFTDKMRTVARDLKAEMSKAHPSPEDRAAAQEPLVQAICWTAMTDATLRATKDSLSNPNPTARIQAFMAYKTCTETLDEMNKGNPKSSAWMLKKTAMGLLYKLQGSATTKWKAVVQMMNWIENKIPILVEPLMTDVFPPRRDNGREPQGTHEQKPLVMNEQRLNATASYQWEKVGAEEATMPKPIKFKKEMWETADGDKANEANHIDRMLKQLHNQPAAAMIRMANIVATFYATVDLSSRSNESFRNKDTENMSKGLAKNTLSRSSIADVAHFINAPDIPYDIAKLEGFIEKARNKGKSKLADLIKAGHIESKAGRMNGLTDMFAKQTTTLCPECDCEIQVKELSRLEAALYSHLNGCGKKKVKNQTEGDPPGQHENGKRSRSSSQGNEHAGKRGRNRSGGSRGSPNRDNPNRGSFGATHNQVRDGEQSPSQNGFGAQRPNQGHSNTHQGHRGSFKGTPNTPRGIRHGFSGAGRGAQGTPGHAQWHNRGFNNQIDGFRNQNQTTGQQTHNYYTHGFQQRQNQSNQRGPDRQGGPYNN